MAGLEPLAALSLACNVFQIVGIGREIIATSRQVFHTGAIDSNAILTDKAALLDKIATDVHAACVAATANNATQPGLENDLLEVCQKCQTVSRALVDGVSRLTGPAAGGSRVTAVRIGIKGFWNKGELKTLEENLHAVESLMNTGMMAKILKRIDSSNIQLDSLSQSHQEFVREYKIGQRSLTNLVSSEAAAIRGAVSAESQRSEAEVKQHITQETSRSSHELTVQINTVARESTHQVLNGVENFHLDAALEAKRDRVLQSLRFPEMNRRQNSIDPEHRHTLQWVLGEKEHLATDWDSFPGWLRSDVKIYWISGKPGAGKSTLLSYLFHNPETQRLLDSERPNTIRVSHFFWRAGSEMQQSFKGLLCSLVFQLVEQDTGSLVYLLEQTPAISAKRSDSDWSVRELQRSLLALLNKYSRPVCMFLDGVDEVKSSDEQFEVLDFIDELGHVPSLKICVSSRPEPTLKSRLGRFPQLKVHHLNRSDLYAYAHERLGVGSRTVPGSLLDSSLVDGLVRKAEGVFLWIRLAVTSIRRGIEHGTLATHQDVAERIGVLPSRIESMCEDMWARLGDDRRVYRERAAFYLNMVLKTFLDPYLRHHVPVTPLHLLLASKPDLIPSLDMLESDEQFNATMDLLHEKLKWLKLDVEATCVGFIESIADTRGPPWIVCSWKGDCAFLSDVNGSTTFGFGHRCFLDFFIESTSAQAILAHAQLSIFQVWIRTLKARATVCSLFIFFPGISQFRGSLAPLDRECPSGLMSYIDLLNHTPAQDPSATDELRITPPLNQELRQAFQSLQQLFRSRRLFAIVLLETHRTLGYTSRRDRPEKFLMLAAAWGDERIIGCVTEELNARQIPHPDLSQFLLYTVAGLPPWDEHTLKARRDLLRLLLSAGADPNAAGSFPFDFYTLRSRPATGQLWPMIAPLVSVLTQPIHRKGEQHSDERILHALGTITSLLEHGASSQDLVFFSFGAGRRTFRSLEPVFSHRKVTTAEDLRAAFAFPAKLMLNVLLDHCRSYRAHLRGSSELAQLERVVLRLPELKPQQSPILFNPQLFDKEAPPICVEITNRRDREVLFERITVAFLRTPFFAPSQEGHEAVVQLREAFRDASSGGTDTGKTMETRLTELGLVVRAEDVIDART
ncbi:hypothetical protein RB601_008536 [Gaeumannomyces tritici]